ncbi:MAG: NUDIX domain-containing protein [Planctomycetota bacterium]
MSRAPFQVLVFPYRFTPDRAIEYAVFKRADAGYWQGIAGGGEDQETPLEAARREAREEAGIPSESLFLRLDSLATIPVDQVAGFLWGDDVLVVPEHCLGVEVENRELSLSREHTEYSWRDYDSALALLKWESNKSALWELDQRLRGKTARKGKRPPPVSR